eukprot:s3439_g7.t1
MWSLVRLTYAGASPKSYWLPATAQPTSLLQRFALRVFQFHSKRLGFTTKTVKRLAGCAGAEFWVQRRGAEVKQARRGMNWHFDKDEDLLDDVGLCVHPLVATATYLTDQGAPLVILSAPTLRRQEDGAPDADAPPPSPGSDAAAFVAFPARGLHVAFGGDLLHGVPAELECRPGERLALLVNVWLHHRPSGLQTCGKSSGTTRGSTKPGSALRVRHRRCPKGGLAISPGLAQWHVDGLRSLCCICCGLTSSVHVTTAPGRVQGDQDPYAYRRCSRDPSLACRVLLRSAAVLRIPRDLHEGVWRIQQKQLRVALLLRKVSQHGRSRRKAVLVFRMRHGTSCVDLWSVILASLLSRFFTRDVDIASHLGGCVSGGIVSYLWGPRLLWSYGGLVVRSAPIITWPFT